MTTSKPDYYAIERELSADDLFDSAHADRQRIATRILAGFYYAGLCEADADSNVFFDKIEKGVLLGMIGIIRHLAFNIEETLGEQKYREMKVKILEVLKSALTPRQ